MSELFPACFSCGNNFNQSHNSLGSVDKYIVFEIPDEKIIKPGKLSNFTSVRSRVNLLLVAFTSKFISFAKSYINFLSDFLARSTLWFLLVITLKKSPFNLNCLFVSRTVKKLSCKVIRIELCNNKSLTLIEVESFASLTGVVF